MTCPRMLKQSWSGSKQKETESEGETIPDAPPPPYTEQASQDLVDNSYPILTEYARCSKIDRAVVLVWALVDIIAVTFSTDVSRLKQALLKTDPSWARVMGQDSSSILGTDGRALVAEICHLIRKLEGKMTRSRWLLVHPRDKHLVKMMVLEPVDVYCMNLDFVLEVLGRFERNPNRTLLDHWSTSPHTTDLGDAIASHLLLLRSLEVKGKIRLVLEDYVAEYQDREGLEDLCTSKELQDESSVHKLPNYWPLSDEYMNLARELRVLRRRFLGDEFKYGRKRLQHARARRNYQMQQRMENPRS